MEELPDLCYHNRRKLSSVGEHSLHRGGVMGSNPIVSTRNEDPEDRFGFQDLFSILFYT